MNVITHNMAYSIFPRMTFSARRSVKFAHNLFSLSRSEFIFEKYGWREAMSYELEDQLHFEQGFRHLTDSKCWTIRLCPSIDPHLNFIESNTWSLRYEKYLPPKHFWSLLDDPNQLRFAYVVDTNLASTIRTQLESRFNKEERQA